MPDAGFVRYPLVVAMIAAALLGLTLSACGSPRPTPKYNGLIPTTTTTPSHRSTTTTAPTTRTTTHSAQDACYKLFASWDGKPPVDTTSAVKGIAADCPTVTDLTQALVPYAPGHSTSEATSGAQQVRNLVCLSMPSAAICEAGK